MEKNKVHIVFNKKGKMSEVTLPPRCQVTAYNYDIKENCHKDEKGVPCWITNWTRLAYCSKTYKPINKIDHQITIRVKFGKVKELKFPKGFEVTVDGLRSTVVN